MGIMKAGLGRAGGGIFNWRESRGRGRCCMLASSWILRIIRDITLGALYSAFLSVNGFSMVDVSLLSVLTLLSSFCSGITPFILERFEKRKWILAGGKLLYYVLSILGLTILPLLVENHRAMLITACVLVFVSGALNTIVTCGYSAWHAAFLQGDARISYFSFQQISSTVIGSGLLFAISAVADSFTGDALRTAIFWIRMFGFVLAVADVIFLTIPEEYAYPHELERIEFLNLFRLPFRHKKFIMTVGLMCIWGYGFGLTDSVLYYYLQKDIGVSLKLLSMNSVVYAVALIVLSGFWRKVLRKYSWLTTFGIAGLVHAVSLLMTIGVTRGNSLWLYMGVNVVQGVAGVGLNLTELNMIYVNTPATDQTYYMGFYSMAVNAAPLLGRLTATLVVYLMGNAAVVLFGFPLGAVRLLLLGQFIAYVLCSFLLIRNRKALRPENA